MENKTKEARRAIQISILTALVLAIAKFAVGLGTHSMALLASALDSLMDFGSSTVNWVAIREASRPPDANHPYGHGKIESLAGLLQSLFICVSGLYLVYEAVHRLITGSTVHVTRASIFVMIVSLLASCMVVWQIKKAARQSRSLVLAAEFLHYFTDIFTNAGIIAALVLVYWTKSAFWDLMISIVVAIYILMAAYRILRRSIDELLDANLPPAALLEIERIILNHHPSIVGVHNLRTHRVGNQIFIDFHIEIRGEDDFKQAHLMTESLIQAVQIPYPDADITVHYDPEGEI